MFKSNFQVNNVTPGETFYKNLSRRVDLLNAITRTKNVTYIRSGDQYILCSNTDGKQWHMKYIAHINHKVKDGQCLADIEFKMAPIHRRMIRTVLLIGVLILLPVTLISMLGVGEINLGLVRALQFVGVGIIVVTLVIAYIEFFLMEKRIKNLIGHTQHRHQYNDTLIIE